MFRTRAARTSLLYSVIRLISPSTVLRKFTHVMTALFFMFWAIITALKTWRCVNNTEPILSLGSVRPKCTLQEVEIFFEVISKQSTDVLIRWHLIFFLLADCVSDVALVNLALKLLWRVKLPQRQRRMILCVSSSSAIMSMFSLFHATCRLIPVESGKHIASQMEVCPFLDITTPLTWPSNSIVDLSIDCMQSACRSHIHIPEDPRFTQRITPIRVRKLLRR